MAEAYDGGPVAALRRIGFLLERGREETYKVKAYRNAAAAILPLGDEEVRARVEAGTIQEIPGVGLLGNWVLSGVHVSKGVAVARGVPMWGWTGIALGMRWTISVTSTFSRVMCDTTPGTLSSSGLDTKVTRWGLSNLDKG